MTKRLDGPRLNTDVVDTPAQALPPLLAALPSGVVFVETCAGRGALIRLLEDHGHHCAVAMDIDPLAENIEERCATTFDPEENPSVTHAITNLPFSWRAAQPIIEAMITWPITSYVLVPADWITHVRFRRYLPHIQQIAPIGRLRWIPGTKHQSTDAYIWLRLEQEQTSFFVTAQRTAA